jgi:hypothetical protein
LIKIHCEILFLYYYEELCMMNKIKFLLAGVFFSAVIIPTAQATAVPTGINCGDIKAGQTCALPIGRFVHYTYTGKRYDAINFSCQLSSAKLSKDGDATANVWGTKGFLESDPFPGTRINLNDVVNFEMWVLDGDDTEGDIKIGLTNNDPGVDDQIHCWQTG